MSEDSLRKDGDNTKKKSSESARIRVKTVIGLLLVLILSFLSTVWLRLYTDKMNAAELSESEMERAQAAAEALTEVFAEEEAQVEAWNMHLNQSADMMRNMLMNFVSKDVYEGPETFSDAVVVRIHNGTAQWPVGWQEGNMTLPEGFLAQPEDTLFYSDVKSDASDGANDGAEAKPASVAARQLCTDTWYLEYTFTDEQEYFLNVNANTSKQLQAIITVCRSLLVVIDNDTPGEPLWNTFELPAETIDKALAASQDGDARVSDGMTEYHVIQLNLETVGKTALFMFTREQAGSTGFDVGMVIGLLIFLILSAVCVFLLSTERMVVLHVLSKPQTIRYNPKAVRRRTAAAGGIALILLFIISLLVQTGSDLYRESRKVYEGLGSYEQGIKYYSGSTEVAGEEEEEWQEYYAERIARLLGTYPELVSNQQLAMMNESLDTEYIMLFDEKGNEIACSDDYINYTLGEEESDPLYPFKRITHGLKTLTLDAGQDFILNKETVLTGSRLKTEEGYGVVLLSSDVSKINKVDAKVREERLMRAAAGSNDLLFSLNEEKTTISSSSLGLYSTPDIATAGMDESILRESEMCRFTLFGSRYYGSSRLINNCLHFYAVKHTNGFKDALPVALYSTLAGALSFLILSVFLLWGCTNERFLILSEVGTEPVRGTSVEIITPDGRIKRTRDPSHRWSFSAVSWKDLLPENKTAAVVQGILAVYLTVMMYILWSYNDQVDSMVPYLLEGTWDKGFNLFATGANLLVIAAVSLAMMVVRILIRLFCTWLDTKVETILRLSYDLLQYVAVFTVLIVCFRNFGIDTSALLTTMGLLSLAVSIGSKDLVADVIAGITIVLEGEYQVGDIVEMDGYRGRVQEIGVRSTKIVGLGDNVKIINNRDVRNVINTTRFNSWYAISLDISTSFEINRLEEILEKELPIIKKKMKRVISGPVYRGVESIGRDSFRIIILTECREEDFRWVQRQVNREIRLLFDREGIPII